MKSTGRRNPVEDPYEVENEINDYCSLMKNHIREIDNEYSINDARLIKKAMIETLLESL
jgi:hypothetical protein